MGLRQLGQISVYQQGEQVHFQTPENTFELPWQLAHEIGRRLRLAGRWARLVSVPGATDRRLKALDSGMIDSKPPVRVYQDGSHVHLQIAGRTIEFPWDLAIETSRRLRRAVEGAEQFEDPQKFIHNQAMGMVHGLPFQTVVSTLMVEEAAKESAELRRYLGMSSVTTKPVVGRPTIHLGEPPS